MKKIDVKSNTIKDKDVISNMLINPKFKELIHTFLLNIVVGNEEVASLNSDDLEMRMYRKSGDKMVELLSVSAKSGCFVIKHIKKS